MATATAENMKIVCPDGVGGVPLQNTSCFSLDVAKRAVKYLLRFGPVVGTRNFLKTHLGHRLVGVELCRESNGQLLWLRPQTSDARVFESVFVAGDYEIDAFVQANEIQRYYARLLAHGKKPVVVDCGANIGAASVWFKRIFPEAAIVAIEPEEENVRILRRNIDGAPDCIAVHGAVWNKATKLRIINEGAEPWAFQVSEEVAGPNENIVPGLTIEQALGLVANGVPLIIKIDIEGAEGNLFAGNTGWLESTPLVIIEPHDSMLPWRGTSRNFLRAMNKFEWDLMIKGEYLMWFRTPEQLLTLEDYCTPPVMTALREIEAHAKT
jgi:FkbM family methyltransferase